MLVCSVRSACARRLPAVFCAMRCLRPTAAHSPMLNAQQQQQTARQQRQKHTVTCCPPLGALPQQQTTWMILRFCSISRPSAAGSVDSVAASVSLLVRWPKAARPSRSPPVWPKLAKIEAATAVASRQLACDGHLCVCTRLSLLERQPHARPEPLTADGPTSAGCPRERVCVRPRNYFSRSRPASGGRQPLGNWATKRLGSDARRQARREPLAIGGEALQARPAEAASGSAPLEASKCAAAAALRPHTGSASALVRGRSKQSS